MKEQCFQLVRQLYRYCFGILGSSDVKAGAVARLWTTEDTIIYSSTEDNVQKNTLKTPPFSNLVKFINWSINASQPLSFYI